MNDLIQKDFHNIDVFRFDFEKQNQMIEMIISNVISWDSIRYRFTKDELKGLASFITKFIET